MRNRHFCRQISGFFMICVCLSAAYAQAPHCERDSVTVMSILNEFHSPDKKPGGLIGRIAEKLVGVPYEEVIRQDSTGVNCVRIDAFDDISFLNNVVSLAKCAVTSGQIRYVDYGIQLMDVSYRRGEENGFASRLIYPADWTVDNKNRNNIRELTEDYSKFFKTKSLDAVTRNRQLYVALKDSDTYEAQRMVEMGYRTHKIPHMRRESFDWKEIASELQDGDIIMLLSPARDYDVYEIGVLRKRDDGMHLIHVDESAGAVVEEPLTIGKYVKHHQKEIYGWRWLRLK